MISNCVHIINILDMSAVQIINIYVEMPLLRPKLTASVKSTQLVIITDN